MIAIVRKELADYFTSIRFFVLFLLVLATSGYGLFAAYNGIRQALLESGAVTGSGFVFVALFTSGQGIFNLIFFLTILVPIVGIALGFDAINSERSNGTLSRLLSQPVYRDSVINGKFLAGIITLTIMITTTLLLVSGYGMRMIGVPPNAEEIIRIFLFLVLNIIYGAFWMGLAMLFSVVSRKVSVSLLITIAIWVIMFLWTLMGPVLAATLAQSTAGQLTLIRISPLYLFSEATTVLLVPAYRLGFMTMTQAEMSYVIPNPLGLGQSMITIWPHLAILVSLSVICFALSYVLFMRQEIRAS
ncbi:MAG: ABC transporter permease [Chloroflexota bacterium]